ncbi:MAG: hypothetical protein K9J37_17105 [Saprospiraceae bacterium]|nr:hypothetical protein [Saprospiraceae bacterium]MCF8251636.1 hypothetical protein [Saprospiraceae bacterium]MCF8281357.1 hypothetical protein [Bacteroidales bacterium]MCF8312274.1 hypothetical protein [Saprospiraceae bacterium]MCF8441982.1 hypothetical protein [Saprospiraceae bacterium]
MPSFPQFVLESLLAFWLLLGYYHLTNAPVNSFRAKRWQLRLVPVLAGLLPLLPAVFERPIGEHSPGKVAMIFAKLLDFQFPEFTVTIGSVFLVVYFVGVLISSFRLTDRLWTVHQFLEQNGNQHTSLIPWQAMPTAAMSSLVLNWNLMPEEEKEAWVQHWLPLHPMYAWEALLVELLLVLNWYNPLAYRYRESWGELYAGWQTSTPERAGFLTVKNLGFSALAMGLSLFFVFVPTSFSSIHRMGAMAANFFGTTICENKIKKEHEYFVDWGGLKMPLTKFANPNGYAVGMELELADFQEIVNKPFTVFKDGKPLKPGTLSIFYKSSRTGMQAYINGIDPTKIVLLDRKNGLVFNDSLDLGDQLTLFGDTEDIYLSRVEIQIKDPDAGYEPSFFVPQINHLEASMPYQIVARKGQRALVKIDPDDPNTDRIVQLYGDIRQYEIVRIPGFHTNRHYITEAESLASKVAAANSTLTFMEKDAFYLPEYQTYQGKDVRMVWGDMVASPSNLNYPLDSFLLSIEQEPRLLVGDDTLDIVSFQVIVAGKNQDSKSFFTYRTGDLAVHDALKNVQNETSVFFEKIVVLDQQRNQLLFPASFAFNVGNPDKLRRTPNSNKNFMLMFGEETQVVPAPIFKENKEKSPSKTKEKSRRKKGEKK